MPDIKMPEIRIPDFNTDVAKAVKDVAAVAKDATYVVIGAGVLGYQQIQVQRQELQKRLRGPKAGLSDRAASVRTDLGDAWKDVDATVDELADRVEEIIERVEAVFAPFEDRLPAQARDLAKQAHVQAREARGQLRTFIPTAGT
ncbi:MAG: hypothetical protein ACRDYE_16230 [Acidimicrobiales bacterium]